MPDAFFFSVPNRNLIVALTGRYGVPTIYFDHFFVEAGGLISYGADYAEQVR
jgi:putative tryptophan/tyrosine transport system substrate-binding protein